MVQIPDNPCYYISAKDGKQSEAYRELIFRSSYLAKEKSKCFTDGERNFGCSIK
ncbi:inovirus-type Gp2 protein [Escherichia coli]|nr:inovirus-type Gp2 protein [Escherichia coli]MBE8542759.1 inovirus-type Gp2 protein [Escherichia coli]MBE8561042.1 inovirus-type Gp2 protein [Escherichia coli]HAX4888429.1 inovirus Gp2 family protein [Escherichia coli]HAY5615882.1 inovirus Gp2 family protein [Escherichia coli]